MKFLSTRDTRRARQDTPPVALPKGPTTADLTPEGRPKALNPLQFIAKHATRAELAALAQRVEARVSAEPRFVYERCNKCGLVWTRPYKRPTGRACVKCNWPGYKDGGFMRPMDAAAVKKHLADKAATEAANQERGWRAGLESRNADRKKAGLAPLTMAAYRNEVGDHYAAMVTRDKKLGDAYLRGAK